MSNERNPRRGSTNLYPAEVAAIENERIASQGPRPSSSIIAPDDRFSLESSEYPSWLPRRPHPPVPASSTNTGAGSPAAEREVRSSAEGSSAVSPDHTMQSPTTPARSGTRRPHSEGRDPTPRSVRILTAPRSRGVGSGLINRSASLAHTPKVAAPNDTTAPTFPTPSIPDVAADGHRPRFRANGLHLGIMRNPSLLNHIYFYLFPVMVFVHIPLQSYLDFNAAYILLQAAKHPTPAALGVPASGRGWALAFAAYIACYFVYLFIIFIGYELLYSFYRQWRTKRPLILSIYLSAPAFNLASMTSYSTFCFLQYIRASAFIPERNGSWRDGIAETCYWYSQNLPTVVLLLPRAALCLAALFAFSGPTARAVADNGELPVGRDTTFFNGQGLLTSYARGSLIANAVWTLWRVMVLLISWVGLWITSGQACAGICGPRYRWEEEDDEKGFYASRTRNERLIERWAWLPFTITRIREAYEFCLTNRVKRRTSSVEDQRHSQQPMAENRFASRTSDSPPLTVDLSTALALGSAHAHVPDDGEQKADEPTATPGQHSGTRRSVLDSDIFTSPAGSSTVFGSSSLVPPVPAANLQSLVPMVDPSKPAYGSTGPSSSGPILSLPFPFFPMPTATTSPPAPPFPLQSRPIPSPRRSMPSTHSSASGSEKDYGLEGFVVRDSDEIDDQLVESPVSATHLQEDLTGEVSQSQQPMNGRASQSLSSLGQPLSPAYLSGSRSPSTHSQGSPLPRSSSSRALSASSQGQSVLASAEPSSSAGSPLSPMMPPPPRHPSAGSDYRRRRAGTAPSLPSSPRSSESLRHRNRTISVTDQTFGVAIPLPPVQGTDDNDHQLEEEDHAEARGSIEEAEKEDSVGLLSSAPSPKSSLGALRLRAQSLVSLRRTSFGSAQEGSRPPSSPSTSRSRAISLMGRSRKGSSSSPSSQAGAASASPSSRSRASSVARQADAHDNTFGIPPSVSIDWDDVPRTSAPPQELPLPSSSNLQVPDVGRTGRTVRPSVSRATTESQQTVSQSVAHTDISEAPSSYVTAPPTVIGSTTEDGSAGTIRSTDPWNEIFREMM
ncbi:uncharacterized protein EI90DRAFT_3132601 [Cantharellus anzutake]|uniref:uncharacterized protein n=1 Tax=Cantharellus anzutake TaxID=1750568 RepID=UPI001903CACA|nr:uncharacterized protein EI90DRAFT_3132601 [Cantharellus anzutake]KAF8319490.1 hypothetical protein EI90DRAFT_3132601 [Cantharellus anzutake]